MIKSSRDWSDENVKQLADQLLECGDNVPDSLFDDLIDANLDLANQIAGHFIRMFPKKRNDIISSAMLGLVRGVHNAPHVMHDNNIRKYLRPRIAGAIHDFLERDFLIRIPRKQWKKMMEVEDVVDFMERTFRPGVTLQRFGSGVLTSKPIIFSMIGRDPETDEEYHSEIPAPKKYIKRDFDEMLIEMHLTERESMIVWLRLSGYTFAEIAERMKLTKPRIIQIIEGLRSRWVELGFPMPRIHHRKISGTKVCTRCETEKSLSEFYKIGEDKFKSICKKCMKEQRLEKEKDNACR